MHGKEERNVAKLKADANKIMHLCLAKGWSIRELGIQSDVAPPTVWRVIQGSQPHPRTAKKIADALQVEVLEIFSVKL